MPQADDVGKRLQERVVRIVVPQLAQGLIEDRQARLGSKRKPIDQELATLFEAARSLLYGSLIELFAAGRGLQTPGQPSGGLMRNVPDTHLSLVIDALSRDPEERTPIDYRSLDVRILGSIHERLLDCVLQLAPRSRRVVLSEGNSQRKASGSYYTPPAIVEYLVANTVGPVLEEKLAALRRGFRKTKTFDSLQDFGGSIDLRLIDPAMGCGHFLIEVVNFITDRLAEFLDEFPSNAVRLVFDRARQSLRESLGPQRPSADASAWSNRQLLKRMVLDQCVYGVDLDPIAVELAKAVLWLDAGVPGPPSTLLDSHLRTGNALVGDLPPARRADPRGRRSDLPCFHWATEFPDAFADSGIAAAGFDCVVGNPPYVRIQNLDDAYVKYLQDQFETAEGKFDLYIPFLERGTGLLRENGLLGMIVPNKFLTAHYGAAFRRFAARDRLVRRIVDFGCERVFRGAGAYCCLLFLGRRKADCVTLSRGSLNRPIARESMSVPAERFDEATWSVRPGGVPRPAAGMPLKAACRAIFQGLITGADRLLIGKREGDRIRLGDDCVEFDPKIFRPVLKGPDVRRFALRFSNHYALYPYRLVDGRTALIAEEELAAHHPGAYRYLCAHRRELERRGTAAMIYPAWYAHWCPRTIERFGAPKIVTQVLASRASFALDRQGAYLFVGGGNAGVYGIIPDVQDEERRWLLLAVLNSRTFDAQVQARSSRFRGGYFSFARRFIEDAVIPQIEKLDLCSSLARRTIVLAKTYAPCKADSDNPLEDELDSAVDELYACGIR